MTEEVGARLPRMFGERIVLEVGVREGVTGSLSCVLLARRGSHGTSLIP